jgi:hypothetical protein
VAVAFHPVELGGTCHPWPLGHSSALGRRLRGSALGRPGLSLQNWPTAALPGSWRSLNPNSVRGQNPLQQQGFILSSNHRLNY